MSINWSEVDSGITDDTWFAHGDRYDIYKVLRDDDPIHWTESERYGRGFWLVSRYDDVKEVLSDFMHYSAYVSGRLPRSGRRMTAGERREVGFDAQVNHMDPPQHTTFRQPINKHFSAAAIGRLRKAVEDVVDDLIASVADQGECDLVHDLTKELPAYVVLEFLGLPRSDWAEHRKLVGQEFSPSEAEYMIPGKDPVQTSIDARVTLQSEALALTAQRRAEPQDDFASIIATLTVEGVPLDDIEVATWCRSLLAAGLETTRNAASVGAWLLLNNPAQRAALMDEPRLIKSAVEEVVRWTTPARTRLRVARTEINMHGVRISPGDWVVPYLASANHDERTFPHPEQFDISRSPNDHVAFGNGVHLCLGRWLARLEIEIFLTKFLRAFPDAEFVEGGTEWILDYQEHGLSSARLRYKPFDHRGPGILAQVR
jgi:cholest-4-en-3-one 26-monooxygenase